LLLISLMSEKEAKRFTAADAKDAKENLNLAADFADEREMRSHCF
jgi:hypothetical protein